MTDLTPAMDAALSAPKVIIFGALEINLPGGVNLRLIDGAGEVPWGGNIFLGRDPTFGVLAAIDPPEDGLGDQAPSMNLTFHPPSTAAAATLAAATMQGSRVRLWLGAVDAGAVVADPYLVFDGELDQPILSVGFGTRVLEYECVSGFERMFEAEEGMRLADSFHQSVWPGETGLAHVTGIVKSFIWGPGDKPAGSITSSTGGSFLGSGLGGVTVGGTSGSGGGGGMGGGGLLDYDRS